MHVGSSLTETYMNLVYMINKSPFLIYVKQVFYFYTLWKHQKTSGFNI